MHSLFRHEYKSMQNEEIPAIDAFAVKAKLQDWLKRNVIIWLCCCTIRGLYLNCSATRWSLVHHIRQCCLCFCGFIFILGSDMHCPQLHWFLGEDAEKCLHSAWADLMWLPQEMLNIGSTSTHHHFALLPPFSSIYTPAGAASGGRTIEVSSLTPAATPALIEPVPDEVMTWSFVLNHCH